MKRSYSLAALGLLALLGVFYAWWWHHTRQERRHDQPIRAAADRYGLSPALVKAVVWRESRFDESARGRAGEIGLMQLRDIAAQEWADAEQIETFEHEHCLDPATNTMAGAYYLSKVMKRYRNTDDPRVYALADYNAGRGNVVKWLRGPAATNSAAFLENMSFPTTREYILSVIKRSHTYELQPW